MLGNVWFILGVLLVVSLVLSSIGFKKFVWFLSIGYGFSILGCGIAIFVMYLIAGKLNITGLLACILFVIYGFRLGGFLALRELKNASYRKTLADASKTSKPIPTFVLVSIWICVGLLYPAEVSGVVFTLFNRDPSSGFMSFKVMEIVGLVIMTLGVFIEGLADHQKSKYKKEDPNTPAMKGLYKLCRCPNYYGEILFWTGVVAYSVTSLNTWWMWVIVLTGWICIVYVMLNSSKRLEKRQNKRYVDYPGFKEYMAKTPVIYLVFIPIKSLANSKIIK